MSTLALKKAIIAKLRTGSAIASGRNYDRAPANPTFPYTTLGPFDELTEEADEYDGKDISFQVDIWTRQRDGATVAASVEVMQIGEAVRSALHEEELTLDGARLVALTIDRVSYQQDPDGLTEHGIVTGRARTEPTA